MNILFYTNIPSPYRMEFFEKLGERCDLTVLFDRIDADDRHAGWMGNVDESRNFTTVVLKGKKLKGDTAFCPEIKKYVKDSKYDVIIIGDYATINGMYAISYMRRNGIPYGIECDGGFVRSGEKKWKHWIKKYLLEKAAFAFSPGKTTNNYLKHYGMDEHRIWFYPFSSLSQADILQNRSCIKEREKYRRDLQVSEKYVVLTVGSMIYRKGIDVLIKAAAQLPKDIDFVVVGGKPTKEHLKILDEYKVENIRFVDFQVKSELIKYYVASDLFVLPTREDIWGLVVGEAMSFGLPVVTTDKCVAGLEMVAREGGEIVKTDDEGALATAIRGLYNDGERMFSIRRRNLEFVKQYSIESMVDFHLDMLKTIGRR